MSLDEILSEFLENTADALEETDFNRRMTATNDAIKEAVEELKSLMLDLLPTEKTNKTAYQLDISNGYTKKVLSNEYKIHNEIITELKKKIKEL